MMNNNFVHHPASYRDPSGFIFTKDGIVYRQVNKIFKENFDFFIASGCYDYLIKNKLLLPHQKLTENLTGSHDWYCTIAPEKISHISYAYEWSFDMLKDAALLTLTTLKNCLSFGIILKDATPYNIQWHYGQLIFIDTLSFEKYEEAPWIAYRQFCECFLGPLLLMHYNKISLHHLQLAYPDGIPLGITSSLLPKRSKFSLHTYLHIHLHAKVAAKPQTAAGNKQPNKLSKQKLLNLISSLEGLINKLKAPAIPTTWSAYYQEASQRQDYLVAKKAIIDGWLNAQPEGTIVADLGANDGEFSKLAAAKGFHVIAADFDPSCINNLYKTIKQDNIKNIQPFIVDLANPAPANGVNYKERSSFSDRCKADMVMALALIHHLCIGKNIPLPMVAGFFARSGSQLIIEFVPKEDEKVQLMLADKKDIYSNYTEANFENAFTTCYHIKEKKEISGSKRILYLMEKRH